MEKLTPSFLLDAVQWLVMLILALVVWTRKPGEDAINQIQALRDDVDEKLSQISGDYIRLEEQVRHLPTEREFRDLTKQISAQTEALTGLKTEIARITNWLINNK
jgi:predicted  nucleic acid-binding Zn-ribbon protein